MLNIVELSLCVVFNFRCQQHGKVYNAFLIRQAVSLKIFSIPQTLTPTSPTLSASSRFHTNVYEGTRHVQERRVFDEKG